MRFHKQLFRHRPDEGQYGDCHRTAIACLLDLQPADVPHFAEKYWNDDEGWSRAEREFLLSKGYRIASVAWHCKTVDELLKLMGVCSPGVYYLLGGHSANGTNHTVVGCGGAIAHDPSLDNSGIVGPLQPEGCFIITWLVPLALCDRAAA